jgi:hypothetical protein
MRSTATLDIAVAAMIGLAGCAAPTIITRATPDSPGTSVHALVLGRVEILVAGAPVGIVPTRSTAASPYGGAPPVMQGAGRDVYGPGGPVLHDADPTLVVFEDLLSGRRYAYEIEDESGAFAVLLPVGRYGVGLRYDEWLADTPARIELSRGGTPYYVGTLRVNFFRERSVRGLWVRAVGGTVPRGDSDFGVTDEWEKTRSALQPFGWGTVLPEKRLMSVAPTS